MTTRPFPTLLAVSLLVNVFAAGAIGGGLFMLSRPAVWRSLTSQPPRQIGGAGSELAPADHERFRDAMQHVFDDSKDLLRTARESRRTAAQLFVQPQFDQAAISVELDRARNADVLLRTRVEAANVAFAATLPADKRALLAQGLARGGPLRHSP